MLQRFLGVMVVILLITCGCSTPCYRQVFQEKCIDNSRVFDVPQDVLYKAVVKTLCARNFIVENEDKDKAFILGKRGFRNGRRTQILIIQAKIVAESPERSMVYLNAMETTESYYVADRTRFFLWIIPLPGGGGKEGSTVKEAERSIRDKKFYNDFLEEVAKTVKSIPVQPPQAAAVIAATVSPVTTTQAEVSAAVTASGTTP